MNNLISSFDKILEFAQTQGVPPEKKRGILREYLQSKFLSLLYGLKNSNKLSFVGGTALRLLRNADRFSEDLDFDNLGLSDHEIRELVEEIVRVFAVENIVVELRSAITEGKTYYDLRFPDVLEALKITTNQREKLMIKVDYSDHWKGQAPLPVLLNKYGFVQSVVTNPINQLLVQKLAAYSQRKMMQPRDVYDIVWLFSQGARIDREFAEANSLEYLLANAIERHIKEGVNESFKNKLAPFLFNPADTKKLDLFESVLNELKNL